MTPILVRYGRSAFVGRFAAADPPRRGASVVVRTARGVELGESLGPLDPRFAEHLDPDGEVLRTATAADHAAADHAEDLADRLLTAAVADGVAFLDCEVTLDRRGAVLHAVAWGDGQLDALLADLSDRFGLAVRLLDVRQLGGTADPPEPKTTCDKPDCGSGGGCGTAGGCSSGGCSRKQVKSAGELTAYFADLREKMEAAGRVALN